MMSLACFVFFCLNSHPLLESICKAVNRSFTYVEPFVFDLSFRVHEASDIRVAMTGVSGIFSW